MQHLLPSVCGARPHPACCCAQVLTQAKERTTYQQAALGGSIVSTLRPTAGAAGAAKHVDSVIQSVQSKQAVYEKVLLDARKASDLVASMEEELR